MVAAKRKLKQQDKVHDRVLQNVSPFAVVDTVIVDDPLQRGDKIRVARSLRDDTLARMHHRNQIDQAQYAAAREWQRHYEYAAIGGVKAMDTTKEPVDGGGAIIEPITDKQRRAVKTLDRCRRALGLEGEHIIVSVLGNGYSIKQLAAARGFAENRLEMEYLGKRFREAVETLAVELGYVSRRSVLTTPGVKRDISLGS